MRSRLLIPPHGLSQDPSSAPVFPSGWVKTDTGNRKRPSTLASHIVNHTKTPDFRRAPSPSPPTSLHPVYRAPPRCVHQFSNGNRISDHAEALWPHRVQLAAPALPDKETIHQAREPGCCNQRGPWLTRLPTGGRDQVDLCSWVLPGVAGLGSAPRVQAVCMSACVCWGRG